MPAGRKPSINPTISKDIHFDARLITQLDLLLYSEVEERVPRGAYQRFFNSLLVNYFETKSLDLGPYVGSLPGEAVIRGRPETIDRLVGVLESPPSA